MDFDGSPFGDATAVPLARAQPCSTSQSARSRWRTSTKA